MASAAVAGVAVALFSHGAGTSAARASEAGTPSFEPGVYQGSGIGKFGPVVVEVELGAHSIDRVEVVSHEETAYISDRAIHEIPAAIVAGQTLAVDAISGATLTSMAILSAVEQCVEQAGGDADALEGAAAESAAAPESLKLEADVVVVGAGGSGMACAVAAAQMGAEKVVVLEKSCTMGGNALVSGGYLEYVDAPDDLRAKMTPDNRAEIEEEIASAPTVMPQDDVKKLAADWDAWQQTGTDRCFDSIELQALQYTLAGEGDYAGNVPFCQNIADLANWLGDAGFSFKPLCGIVGYPWPRWTAPAEGTCGQGYFAHYSRLIEENDYPVEILLNTPATQLMTEGDKVVGVRGVGDDGTQVEVRASRGVVLATGGFSGNADMLRAYNTMWPFDQMDFIPTTNTYGHDGDGIKMAQDLGAGVMDMDDQMPFPMADCKNWTDETTVGDDIDCMIVNAEGKRFMNEVLDRYSMTDAIIKQPGQKMFMISDADTSRVEGDVNRYGRDLQNLIDQGQLFVSDTIEGLAEAIGCDPAVLVKTVEDYNAYAQAGVDPDFGRTSFTELSPIVNPPFYASPRTWAMHITVGGLLYDESYRVLREDETPIEGLYACGEVLVGSSGVGTQGEGLAVARILMA